MPLPKKIERNKAELNNNVNTMPPIDDDDVFIPLSVDEQEMEDEIEAMQDEPEYVAPPNKKELPKRPAYYNIDNPNYDNPMSDEDEDDDKYIDKKKLKIIPIGGKKAKSRANDFDDRKNTLVTIKITRLIISLFLIVLFGLGIKNTFFPEQIYTPEEIEYIATNAVGNTGFPIERGRAFAQEFLYYYLNSDTKDKETRQILTHFYEGKFSTLSSAQTNKRDVADTHQRPLTQPILFDEFTPTEYTGVYKFSVFVTDTDGETLDLDENIKAHWISFNVNVYHDKEKDTLTIHPDSPTMIPTYRITNNSKIPNEKLLGNGEKDESMLPVLSSTIDGFIVAYAQVNVNSHSEIDQYIPADPDVTLISGFDNTVKLAKNPKTSIQKSVYRTDNPDEWKVDVRVEWLNNQVSENPSSYKSRYVMTINKTADDVYLVTKFVPYTFIKADPIENQ